MVDYARMRGSQVFLFQVPEYYEPEWDKTFLEKLEKQIDAKIITPDLSYRTDLYTPGNYHDPTHFSDERSLAYSRWLAQKILNLSSAE